MGEVERVDNDFTWDLLDGSSRITDEEALRDLCCWLRSEIYKRGNIFLGVNQEPP